MHLEGRFTQLEVEEIKKIYKVLKNEEYTTTIKRSCKIEIYNSQ